MGCTCTGTLISSAHKMLLNGLGIRLFCDHRRNCRSKHAPVSDFILVLRLLASQTLLCCAYRHSLYSPSSASPCLIFTVFYIHRALPTPFLHPALPSPCFLTLRTLNIPLSLYPHPMWCDVWVWASALQPHTLTLSHTHTHTHLITCTCCYDQIKGTQDQDLSYSFSNSLPHTVPPML